MNLRGPCTYLYCVYSIRADTWPPSLIAAIITANIDRSCIGEVSMVRMPNPPPSCQSVVTFSDLYGTADLEVTA